MCKDESEWTHRLQPARQDPLSRERNVAPRPLEIPQRRAPVYLGEHLLYPFGGCLPRAHQRRRVISRLTRPPRAWRLR